MNSLSTFFPANYYSLLHTLYSFRAFFEKSDFNSPESLTPSYLLLVTFYFLRFTLYVLLPIRFYSIRVSKKCSEIRFMDTLQK